MCYYFEKVSYFDSNQTSSGGCKHPELHGVTETIFFISRDRRKRFDSV